MVARPRRCAAAYRQLLKTVRSVKQRVARNHAAEFRFAMRRCEHPPYNATLPYIERLSFLFDLSASFTSFHRVKYHSRREILSTGSILRVNFKIRSLSMKLVLRSFQVRLKTHYSGMQNERGVSSFDKLLEEESSDFLLGVIEPILASTTFRWKGSQRSIPTRTTAFLTSSMRKPFVVRFVHGYK